MAVAGELFMELAEDMESNAPVPKASHTVQSLQGHIPDLQELALAGFRAAPGEWPY